MQTMESTYYWWSLHDQQQASFLYLCMNMSDIDDDDGDGIDSGYH